MVFRNIPLLMLAGVMVLGLAAGCGKKVTPQTTGGLLSGSAAPTSDDDDANKRGLDRDVNDGKTRAGPTGGTTPPR